jgi:hypothetical protein
MGTVLRPHHHQDHRHRQRLGGGSGLTQANQVSSRVCVCDIGRALSYH